MGACGSTGNGEIHRAKLLLLGAGGAGKSTIFKQVRLLALEGFEDDIRMECVVPIIQNIVDACQKLVKISLKHELPLASKTMNESEVIRSTRVNSAEDDFSALKDAVKIIWADPQIKKAFSLSLGESSSKDAVNANDDFFLSKADKVLTPGYVPTDEDILKLRRSTSGAHSLDFKFDPKKFGKGHDKGISGQKHKSSYWTLTDVGGQIHERATWYEEFADLDGLVFVLSLPDFDQKSQDNRSANKLVEDGINLMLQVMRADNLLEVPVCVLLNKFDIFVKKIAASDEGINAVFPEYKGNPKNAEECALYIENFIREEISKDSKVTKSFYITQATDTDMIANVISKIIDSIALQNMKRSGIDV
ncbi:hypothetical protein TrRE_jg7772 [Triparma retinervis]|uniref:Uncharacterized protein n=1 Tax=Triparma retinervis TaxID=2557542 RepID=A0A9W7KST5_9STRA|nr:hypothetical protein TrRE_jg7772 [Triparma retinervis]